MERRRLTYQNSTISYLVYGSGLRPVACFHGYGETAESFAFLEKYAGNEYSFYSFDLPFHGLTEWKEGRDFEPEDLLKIIDETIFKDRSWVQKLVLSGFSLGGRVALSYYQERPGTVDKIVLFAPDGLKMNFWYWLATQNFLGRGLFRFTMRHPQWFFTFLKTLNRLKLVNPSIFKFVNYYIGDKEVRKQLFDRWTGLKDLRPRIAKIKDLIRANGTQVRLVYGKHDKIILPARGEKFRKKIEDYCTIKVIESGHQVLHEKHVKDVLNAFKE